MSNYILYGICLPCQYCIYQFSFEIFVVNSQSQFSKLSIERIFYCYLYFEQKMIVNCFMCNTPIPILSVFCYIGILINAVDSYNVDGVHVDSFCVDGVHVDSYFVDEVHYFILVWIHTCTIFLIYRLRLVFPLRVIFLIMSLKIYQFYSQSR